MQIVKAFFIAFSLYSQIPVPQFAWKEKDMRYVFCFFPWVGAVIGIGIQVWDHLCGIGGLGATARIAVGTAIPLLVTGGFHVDGFLDTMDALHSYQPRERKLEILKDAHIGAFAVIMFAAYGLIYLGAFSEIKDERLLKIVCGGFFLSRCLSGISVVTFPKAKKDGMLSETADSASVGVVKKILYLQSGACIGWMLYWSAPAGMFVAGAALVSFGYYYRRSRKEFGGITGDTAGYFVLICELSMICAAAIVNVLLQMG